MLHANLHVKSCARQRRGLDPAIDVAVTEDPQRPRTIIARGLCAARLLWSGAGANRRPSAFRADQSSWPGSGDHGRRVVDGCTKDAPHRIKCGLDEVIQIPDLVRIAGHGKPELQTNGETRLLRLHSARSDGRSNGIFTRLFVGCSEGGRPAGHLNRHNMAIRHALWDRAPPARPR